MLLYYKFAYQMLSRAFNDQDSGICSRQIPAGVSAVFESQIMIDAFVKGNWQSWQNIPTSS
jgi:hypothetical protein